MQRLSALLATVALGGLGLLALAAEPTKPASQPNREMLVKYKEACEPVDQMCTAQTLIAYGNREKSPLALLLAADMLHDVDARPGQMKTEDGKTVANEPVEPQDLVKKARDLSDSPDIVALCDDCSKRLKEAGKGRDPHPTSFSGALRGAAIVDHLFFTNQPAALFVFCAGGQAVTVKVLNQGTVPPTVVGEQTGSSIRLEWVPAGDDRSSPHKIIITPMSPPPFQISWGTN